MEDIFSLPLEERKAGVVKRMEQYKDHVPVVFRFSPESELALKMTNSRKFVSKKQRLIEVAKNLRVQYKLNSEMTLNFSSNEKILPATLLMEDAYEKFKSEDMILYLKINEMSPFGGSKREEVG